MQFFDPAIEAGSATPLTGLRQKGASRIQKFVNRTMEAFLHGHLELKVRSTVLEMIESLRAQQSPRAPSVMSSL